MFRFAQWLELESFMDSMDREALQKKALAESFSILESAAKIAFGSTNILENEQEDEGPAELEDPFTGGEDAKPKWVDEDGEKSQPPKENRGSENPKSDADFRKIIRSLRTIRNNAILERARKVELTNRIREEIEKGKSDEDYDYELDHSDAIPVLKQLGYLSEKEAGDLTAKISTTSKERKEDPSKKEAKEIAEREIERKLIMSSQEKGNDPTSAETGDLDQAKQELYEAMSRIYGRKLDAIASRNQRNIGDKKGHQFYEPEELANEMYLKIVDMVSKRRWKGGELQPWGEGVKIDDILDSEGDIDPDRIYAYFAKTLGTTASKMRTDAGRSGNPASKGRIGSEIHTNKFAKIALIKKDISSENLGFYINYLERAAEVPFGRRSPEENLVDADNSDDKLRLQIIKAIEQEYESRPSSREILSLSRSKESLIRTLGNYVIHFLRQGEKKVTHASTLAGKDNDSSIDSDLSRSIFGGKGAMLGAPESDDEYDPSGNNPMDSSHSANQGFTAERAVFDFFKPYMIEAINEISSEGGVTMKGNPGANEALALCIKFGIPCSVTTMVKEKVDPATGAKEREVMPKYVVAQKSTVPNFSPEIRNYFQWKIKQKIKEGSWSWSEFCKESFNKFGIRNLQVIAGEWKTHPKNSQEKLSSRNDRSMDAYLYGAAGRTEGGLSKLCRKMQELMPPWVTELSKN